MSGLPTLLGMDISGSMSINVPFAGKDSVWGVYGGLIDKASKSADAFHNGQILRAIEYGSPQFIERPMKAAREYKEGATTPKGKPLFDEQGRPLKPTASESAFQAVGKDQGDVVPYIPILGFINAI